MKRVAPPLTPEQRKAASQKAVEARRYRAKIKYDLCNGDISVKEVLQLAKTNPYIGKITTLQLLVCLPGLGKKRGKEALEKAQIPIRHISSLGRLQKNKLLKIYSEFS